MKGFKSIIRNLLGTGDNQKVDSEQEPSTISGKALEGAICQVTIIESGNNFIGRIESYDTGNNEFTISGNRSGYIGLRSIYDTPVNIYIKRGEQVVLVHGVSTKQSEEFWYVAVDYIEEHSEQREGFRQPLNGMSTVIRRVDGKQEVLSCKLVDISLTGICIACKEDLNIGEKVGIQKVRLSPEASDSYTFDCEIRRAFIRGKDNEMINLGEKGSNISEDMQELQSPAQADRKTPQEKYYGCSFLYLSSEEQEKLCKDIFAIQQQRKGS